MLFRSRNKSIAYDVELLISKAFGTGVAHFHFESGIVKNASFRDRINPINIVNVTTHPQQAKKNIGFNNSQIKTHYHTYDLNNSIRIQQNIDVTDPPLKLKALSAYNVDPYYYYRPQNLSKTGTYQKLNNGNLVLDIDKPIFSGVFSQNIASPSILVTSPDHQMTPNTYTEISFLPDPVSGIALSNTPRKVGASLSNNSFFVEFLQLSGYLSYHPYTDTYDIGRVIIDQDSLLSIDAPFYFRSSGILNNQLITGVDNPELLKFLRPGMNLKIVTSNNIIHNRVVSNASIASTSITINNTIQTTHNNTVIDYQGAVTVYSLEYVYHLLKISDRFFVDNYTGQVGQFFANPLAKVSGTNFQQTTFGRIPGSPSAPTGYTITRLQNSGIYEILDFDHKESFGVDMLVSKQFVYRSGLPVTLTPIITNSGSAILHQKRNYVGTYQFYPTNFNRYEGIYRRLNDGQTSQLMIFNQKLEPINMPFAPIKYSLVSGFGDFDNHRFFISGTNDQYALHTNARLNYEEQDIYSIRLKAEDRSGKHILEKQIYVYLNDSLRPYLNIQQLPMQSAVSLDPFTYTLPENIFGVEENGGPLTLSATIKNWHSLPEWLSFDPNSLTFSGVPSGCSLGPQTIRVLATNASGYTNYIDWRLNVVDPNVQSLSYFNNQPTQSNDPNIRDILLSKTNVDENLPASAFVASLSSVGSYFPYLSFESAYNNFSGIFRNGSPLIECTQVRFTGYPTAILTGTPALLATGSVVSSMFNNWGHVGALPANTKVTHVYKPLVFSGTPLINADKIIFHEFDFDYNHALYTGAKILAEAEYFDPTTTIKTWNDYSLTINSVVLQENEYLLWTENDDVILHQDLRQTVNGIDTENRFDLFTENQEEILREDSLAINTIWASGYNRCEHGDLLKGELFFYNSNESTPLRNVTEPIFSSSTISKLNPPSPKTLKITNMTAGYTPIIFQQPINNTVMAIYNAGLDEWGELLTEDDSKIHSEILNDSLVSDFLLDYDCELLAEDNHVLKTENYSDELISDSFFDHGSRIEISDNYEIIEGYNVHKNNGKLGTQEEWDFLLTEDDQPLVHDYAITSKAGSAFVLFPGRDNRNINLYYPERGLSDNVDDYEKNIYYTVGSLIPFGFATDKYVLRVDKPYVGQSAAGTVVYSGGLPDTNNYSPSGLQYYDYDINQCGNLIPRTGLKGFCTTESGSWKDIQYVTGLVSFYTEAGTGLIDLALFPSPHLDQREENFVYIKQFTKNPLSIGSAPKPGLYKNNTISNLNGANIFSIYNQFLLPNSGSAVDGGFTANIDKNHGYSIKSNVFINHIPARFNNVSRSLDNQNISNPVLRPKDSILNIVAITGNKITVDDSKNYLLKEIGRPDYFEHSITSNYTTNGLSFLGSVFLDHSNIYDIRYDRNTLERMIKLCTFEYRYGSSPTLSINIPSGSVRPFDDLIVRFPTGVGYDTNPVYKLINTDVVRFRSELFADLEPLKDELLLESSASYSQTSYVQKLLFNNTALANLNRDINGTCDLDLKIEHRIQPGYNINYHNSPKLAHTVLTIESGFTFSGFIPRYNNVISTDIAHKLLPEHIGHASIFHTGSSGLLDGGRLLRQAEPTDKGCRDYYFVGSSGIVPILTSVSGVGSTSLPYKLETSGLPFARSYDFLYLGQNPNQIQFYGSGASNGFNHIAIYRYTLEQQIQLMRLNARGINSGVSPVHRLSNYSGNFNFNISVNRFDQLRVVISGNPANALRLNTSALSDVNPKPWILESSVFLNDSEEELFLPYLNQAEPDLIFAPNASYDPNTLSSQYIPLEDPNYSIFKPNNYYVLPFLRTSEKYCDSLMSKNMPFFFNGNTMVLQNLNSAKSYSQTLDEFLLLSFNGEPVASSGRTGRYVTKIDSTINEYSITGIVTEGAQTLPPRSGAYRFPEIYEDKYRFNTVLGTSYNRYLPYTGVASFIKSTSGYTSIFDYNNIYYHTHGGFTANWPMDSSGKTVPTPQTGVYVVTDNPSSCASGTLCVIISGFNNHSFTGINEINSRTNFGQFPNIASTSNATGYIRPYGANQKFYFDFTDGFSEINGIYYINDMISSNLMTISIPYRTDFVGRRGIVYLIDSDTNIKSHLNPNINNEFIISNGNLQSQISLLNSSILNYFDNTTKRWKHAANLKENIPYTGHVVAFNDAPSTILSINPKPIRISGIEYRFNVLDDDAPYLPLTNSQLIIPSDKTSLNLKITTLDGEQKLVPQYTPSMPKVGISGLFNYTVETNQPGRYNYHGSGWHVGVNIDLPQYDYSTLPVSISIKDLTGENKLLFDIQKKIIPAVKPMSSGYAITNGVWYLGFDVIGYDNLYTLWSNGDLGFNIQNLPSNTYQIKYVGESAVVFTGLCSSVTGNYYPVLKINDFTTEPYSIISSGTGFIGVRNNLSEQPPFNMQLNNLASTYYFDISKSSDLLTFDIPASLGPEPDQVTSSLNIIFSTDTSYRLHVISQAYDYDLRRFHIMARPIRTGDFGYIDTTRRSLAQSVNISLKQPVYDSFGSYVYNNYTKSFGFNTICYRPLNITKTVSDNSLVFYLDQPWFVQLDAIDGITAHDPTTKPRIRIHNTPNFGSYETSPLEYNLDWTHDPENNKWSVIASAKKDFFNKYVYDTGVYPLYISVHDNLSGIVHTETAVRYIQQQTLKNIADTVYATPNNEFFAVADITDLNDANNQPPNIISTLKEPSVQLNNTLTKTLHDTDLNLWQCGITSNKFTDKYDARILVNNDTITVQCQGLGGDKIIAAARLNMVEIEDNQIQGLPLTITGIVGYNPISGTPVSQGDDAWVLSFKTIGGLADYRYPPTIILQNMPTFCDGFNPLIDIQQQCVSGLPKWSPNDMGGSWSYTFSGVPSCTLLGRKDFSITAIDTNPTLTNPYLPDTDTVDYFFVYNELNISFGKPQILEDPEYAPYGIMKPLCDFKYQKKLLFGPANAPLCSHATGIKKIDTSGSLPPGLSYTIFFPGIGDNPNPEPPYSNLGSGYLLIEGFPTTFASGGPYNEKFGLIVTDARNRSGTKVVTFEDSSGPLDPNVSLVLYFDSHKPALSPDNGTNPVKASAMAGGGPDAIVSGYRPAAAAYDLICESRLPHNKCAIENVIYSGNLTTNTRIRLNTSLMNIPLMPNNQIYIEFNNNTNHPLNDTYTVFSGVSDGLYIDPGVSISPVTGYARLVKGVQAGINAHDFSNFFPGATLDDSTRYCILGGGSLMFSTKSEENNRLGVGGLLVPTATGSLTGMNIFPSSDVYLSGLTISDLDNNTANNYSTSRWFN